MGWKISVSIWNELGSTLIVPDQATERKDSVAGIASEMSLSSPVRSKRRENEIPRLFRLGREISVSLWSELNSTLLVSDCFRNIIQVSSMYEAKRK